MNDDANGSDPNKTAEVDTNQKTSSGGSGGGSTKRKRRQGGGKNGNGSSNRDDDNNQPQDAYQQAYAGVQFHPIPSTGRPGTPHCYFAESYAVEVMSSHDAMVVDEEDTKSVTPQQQQDDDPPRQQKKSQHRHHQQVVHKHANGLVIVTAGGPDWWLSSPSLSASSLTAAATASAKSPLSSSPPVQGEDAPFDEAAVNAADSADIAKEVKDESLDRTKMNNSSSSHTNDKDTINMVVRSIDFKVQEAAVASQNAASKRKHQGKMLKGKRQVQEEEGIVRPSDVLAVVQFQNTNDNNNTMDNDNSRMEETATTSASTSNSSTYNIPLSCCVWGTILERNHVNLDKNPALLQQDPLLDGYLAVVLPTGPFPPPPPPPR